MDAFIAGLTDAMKGKEYALNKEEMQAVMQKFQLIFSARWRTSGLMPLISQFLLMGIVNIVKAAVVIKRWSRKSIS